MLEDRQLLPPPWIAYPEIERYSIGWRMGYGESYIDRWGVWFDNLTQDERNAYQELFPEPVTWKGYWNEEYEEDCYQRNEFVMELWRENGMPKYSIEQIREAYVRGERPEYIFFWKAKPSPDGSVTKSCLSQWWKSDFLAAADTYCCMEQFMMTNKAELFEDTEIRRQILQCKNPREMKALGRKVKNFEEVVWDEAKYPIVLNGNYMKFTQNPGLRKFLISTGESVIVEASPFDAVWGIHMGQEEEDILNPLKWRGENLLGFALMEVRDEIRRVWNNVDMCVNVSDVE